MVSFLSFMPMMPRCAAVPALVAAALLAGCATEPESAHVEGARRPAPWLVDVTATAGLDFRHEAGFSGRFRMPEIMGSGAALFDADGDGDLDVFLVNGRADLDREDTSQTDRLYRQDPPGRFTDVTERAGLGGRAYGMGVAVGDIDNDGDEDVFVTNYGPDRLYENRGDGTFSDITDAAGIEVDGWSSSATFFDYDRDGLLDLFVARYVRYDPHKTCTDRAGRPDYCQPQAFPASTCVLLHNEGARRFIDVSARAGLLAAPGPGLGVVADDFDDDGWPDVFVANDGAANHLWMNQHDGTFIERAVRWGVAYNLSGRAQAGMGVACTDFDSNGRMDLLITNLGGETNTLFLNQGPPAGFTDATGESGMAETSLPVTGFGTAAPDLDLDGNVELLVANGRVIRGPSGTAGSAASPLEPYAEENHVFVGLGGGRLRPGGAEFAPFTEPLEVSRGLATGDVDADGDLDILVSNAGGPARLFLNEAPRRGAWLLVKAVDPRYRRDAIGARVTLVTKSARYSRTISAGFSYLSSSAALAHFGLPRESAAERVEVRWPDGREEWFPVEGLDRRLTLERGSGRSPS
jgi:hypothetical protein